MQIVSAVRTDMDPDSARERRLKPSARLTPGLDKAAVDMTDVDEREPLHLALVRLVTVIMPAPRAPAPAAGEQATLPYLEQQMA